MRYRYQSVKIPQISTFTWLSNSNKTRSNHYVKISGVCPIYAEIRCVKWIVMIVTLCGKSICEHLESDRRNWMVIIPRVNLRRIWIEDGNNEPNREIDMNGYPVILGFSFELDFCFNIISSLVNTYSVWSNPLIHPQILRFSHIQSQAIRAETSTDCLYHQALSTTNNESRKWSSDLDKILVQSLEIWQHAVIKESNTVKISHSTKSSTEENCTKTVI